LGLHYHRIQIGPSLRPQQTGIAPGPGTPRRCGNRALQLTTAEPNHPSLSEGGFSLPRSKTLPKLAPKGGDGPLKWDTVGVNSDAAFRGVSLVSPPVGGVPLAAPGVVDQQADEEHDQGVYEHDHHDAVAGPDGDGVGGGGRNERGGAPCIPHHS